MYLGKAPCSPLGNPICENVADQFRGADPSKMTFTKCFRQFP